MPTRLVYDLDCDCDLAFDKLKTLAVGHTKEGLLRAAELDDAGRIVEIELPWIKRDRFIVLLLSYAATGVRLSSLHDFCASGSAPDRRSRET